MKKISLLLIFCFLFQGCVSYSLGLLGKGANEAITKNLDKNNNCSIEEFLHSPTSLYALGFAVIGSIIDIGLVRNYYLHANPTGLVLFGTAVYIFYAVLTPMTITDMIAKEKLWGWEGEHGNKCKEDYFVFPDNDRKKFKNNAEFFLKQLLYYPHDYDISQDQNFANFQKDFLRNYKIQTYSKDNYFYRYIHYPGGKAKFEEDFGKYLYKQEK